MTAPALHLVDRNTGEIHSDCPHCSALAEEVVGMRATVSSQAAMIGRLKGKLEAQDPESHPKHKEMSALLTRWRVATNHPKAKASKDRYDLLRARLNDCYDPSEIELAIDGLGAFPYRSFDKRLREGDPSQRDDQLSVCLKSGEALERMANLGAIARKNGWVTWA